MPDSRKGASSRTEQNFWSSVALALYLGLFAALVSVVVEYGDMALTNVGFFDLAVMGLASFRVIHLLIFDKIFDMVRAAFMAHKGARLEKAERGWRRLMCE